MGVVRWIFRRPKGYRKPQYTQYQKRAVLKKYPNNPGPNYKVSRVKVPSERQDSLFSAFMNWIFRMSFKRKSGGRY